MSISQFLRVFRKLIPPYPNRKITQWEPGTDDIIQYQSGIQLARRALEEGKYDCAGDRLSELIEKCPDRIVAYEILGEVFRRIGDIEAVEVMIRQAPKTLRLTDHFSARILVPHYVYTRDWGRFAQLIEDQNQLSPSEARSYVHARFHAIRSEWGKLRLLLENVIDQYPGSLRLQTLLLRSYIGSGHLHEVSAQIGRMKKYFSDDEINPVLIALKLENTDGRYRHILSWLKRNPKARASYMLPFLDHLLVSGKQDALVFALDNLDDQFSDEEILRIRGMENQIADLELLRCAEVDPNWKKSSSENLDQLKISVRKCIHAGSQLEKSGDSQSDYYSFYERALQQYHAAHMFTLESFYDAESVASLLEARIMEGKPTSLIRLGDGEGRFLPYQTDRTGLPDPSARDRNAIQQFWWGQELMDERDAEELSRSLIQAINHADILGVPPLWRLVSDIFHNGQVVANGPAQRGNLAVVDFLSCNTPARDQIITSSAVHNDLRRWNLYPKIFAPVDSVSFVSCHHLQPVLKNTFGLKTRIAILIPGEFRYQEMFSKSNERTVADHRDELMFPDAFQSVSRDIQPLPGEVFLVAAGFLGKIFCQLIKERGGIAIDIGSTADYWNGHRTRRYM